ncbi:MAG: hypothetical protein CMM15_09875 [Rhodospirillaceae bacterium]|nr:hypothetical protein [Rhodospirillaceae bacterium]OUU22321.1 MAG: hypothetical protein CBB97_15385 [Candidatus Endolissoclinum sp. TMED37]
MAKRESKKSVSLTDPKPNAEAAGPSSMNYKAKERSTIKWFIAGALVLITIFLGGGLLFFDHFPILRQFTLVEFLKQSFALKETEGNTNSNAFEKKVESGEENKEGSNKTPTERNIKRDSQLAAQLKQVSDRLYFLQQRVRKLEKDQKEFDAYVSSQRRNRLSTDEKQIKLYMPKEAADSDQNILIKIQDIKSELNDLKAELQDKKLFIEGNKRDISILLAKKSFSETDAPIDVTTPKLLQMGVGQLANSIASGQDFSFQLALIEQLFGDELEITAIVEELKPIAPRGVKSKNFLKNNFTEKLDRLSIPTIEEETIFGELKHQFKSLVKVKKLRGIGLDTDKAILVDAHEAVRENNFKLAAEKISSLPNSIRIQMNDWLMIVKDREDAYRLLAKLKQLTLLESRQKNN